MARFGPWTLLRVDDLEHDKENWEHCERCGEHIRYVYVCQVERETKEWRIGSSCGPTLIAVSDELWGRVADAAKRDLILLHRALRIRPLEAGANPWGKHLGLDWVDRFISCLEKRETDKYDLSRNKGRPIHNLKLIQSRLKLAEDHHGLRPYKPGEGK
jgi:hypothetical protein